MALAELIMPKMGESIMEATILSWLKKPGDKIEQDESVLEVATDKVDTEVPSTHAGVLKEILAKQGDVIQVGKPIAIIEVEKEVTESNDQVDAPVLQEATTSSFEEIQEISGTHTNGKNHLPVDFKSSTKFFSPLVKNIAKEENISVVELESIPGSGAEGRITKKDILEYVQNRKLGATIQA